MNVSTSSKVIRVLEGVAASGGAGTGVRELARDTGIDRSAVSRICAQLTPLGMVEKSLASGRYVVGPRLLALAALVHASDGVWVAAEPILRRLAEPLNETCYLTMLAGHEFVFRDKVDCDQTIRYVIELGQPQPLHVGAAGRAILSGLDDEQFRQAVAALDLEAVTDKTVTDVEELRRLARADRKRGYSVSRGERVLGGSAIAAPYFDSYGRCLGSITLTAPVERLPRKKEPQIAQAVRAAADELSARLGYDRDGSHAHDGGAPA